MCVCVCVAASLQQRGVQIILSSTAHDGKNIWMLMQTNRQYETEIESTQLMFIVKLRLPESKMGIAAAPGP